MFYRFEEDEQKNTKLTFIKIRRFNLFMILLFSFIEVVYSIYELINLYSTDNINEILISNLDIKSKYENTIFTIIWYINLSYCFLKIIRLLFIIFALLNKKYQTSCYIMLINTMITIIFPLVICLVPFVNIFSNYLYFYSTYDQWFIDLAKTIFDLVRKDKIISIYFYDFSTIIVDIIVILISFPTGLNYLINFKNIEMLYFLQVMLKYFYIPITWIMTSMILLINYNVTYIIFSIMLTFYYIANSYIINTKIGKILKIIFFDLILLIITLFIFIKHNINPIENIISIIEVYIYGTIVSQDLLVYVTMKIHNESFFNEDESIFSSEIPM